jgi:hypothetical protein
MRNIKKRKRVNEFSSQNTEHLLALRASIFAPTQFEKPNWPACSFVDAGAVIATQ